MKAIRINLLNQKKMKESLQKNISIKQLFTSKKSITLEEL